MKRIPVTKASYKKIPKTPLAPGKTISATSHSIDKDKHKVASFMGGFGRAAWNRPTMLGGASSFYQNSYMGGGSSGFGDMPQYFAFLNEQNGGVLYYPVTLKEKYEWYRYFFRCFVDENVEILTENGTNKKISELQNGDTIINGFGKKVDVINKVENEYKGDVYSIFVENGKKHTFVTADHLYLVIENDVYKWKRADEIYIGCNLCGEHNKTYPVKKIEKKCYEGKVFCITTNGKNYDDCSFVANGLVNHNCDPYVHAAICLHTDLPMSKLVLRMPKMKDKQKRKNILAKYQTMVNDLKLFDKLHSILFETNVIGNCFVFVQYNDEKQAWDKITILPPEEIDVANYPMSDIKCVQYRPEILNSIISKYSFPLDDYNAYCKYVDGLDEDEKQVLQDVDFELVKQLKENNGALIMDTNPYSGDGNSKIGSFVFHFCEKRHEYQDLGVSPLECILTPLLMKEHYKHTQLSLASRNMTPRNIVSADGISKDALDDLRDQIDQSMLSPDYSIVTNYEIHWETIGAENRLIDLSREYESIENQIFAGLGVTREVLTGEGMYSGNKISVEILNTRYLFKRELLQSFVEDNLFKPYALQNGFFEDDENGNRTWFYPKLSFTRLTIRDNNEVFDSLFQLYQKGSIPIGTILDLFNLDEDEVDEKLKKDMFTPKDATYNDMLRGVYSSIGDQLVQGTDLAKQIIESITGPMGRKLVYKDPDKKDEDDGWGNDFYDNNDDLESEEEEGDFDDGEFDESNGFDENMNQDEKPDTEESNENVKIDKEDMKDTLNDIIDEDKLKDDLSNQSPEEQNDLVKKYLEEIQNETNENKGSGEEEKNQDDEPNVKESFKIAKKSE